MRSYDTFTVNDLQTLFVFAIFVFACHDQTSSVAGKKPVRAKKEYLGCVTCEKGLFDLEIFQGVAFSYA